MKQLPYPAASLFLILKATEKGEKPSSKLDLNTDHLPAHSTGKHKSTCTSSAVSKPAGITQERQIKEAALTAIQNNAFCSQGNKPERESKQRPSKSNMWLDQENM